MSAKSDVQRELEDLAEQLERDAPTHDPEIVRAILDACTDEELDRLEALHGKPPEAWDDTDRALLQRFEQRYRSRQT